MENNFMAFKSGVRWYYNQMNKLKPPNTLPIYDTIYNLQQILNTAKIATNGNIEVTEWYTISITEISHKNDINSS